VILALQEVFLKLKNRTEEGVAFGGTEGGTLG
jgi:hypothetical protein